jgi:hypothetical protein
MAQGPLEPTGTRSYHRAMIKRLPRRASLSKTFAAGVVVALAFTVACGGNGKSSPSPSATSWTRAAPISSPPSSPKEAVEAAVFRDFQWSGSATYRASDVACYPIGEKLRGTPVYWCSIGYGDNQGSTGACVNLAGGDLAMSGPVIRQECNRFVAKARANGFVTQAYDTLP